MSARDLLINAFIVTQFIPFWTPIYYAVGAYACYFVYRVALFLYNQIALQKHVHRIRLERDKNFESAREFVKTVPAETRKHIRSLTYSKLKEKLQNGEITCVQALASVIDHCLDRTDLNAVNLFMLDAIDIAKEWDSRANEAGFERPPLFGIPISVKESTVAKGCAQTLGFISRADTKAEKHPITIQKLVDKGGIPFCVTNVCQTLSTFDCQNPIYGATINPHLEGRTPGGSSGGEGALVGAKISYVGMASDVAGSTRIPAHFCGAVGVKPGSTRIAQKDGMISLHGRTLMEAAEGPIGQTVEACTDILSSLIDAEVSEADPYVPPIPWREEIVLHGKKNMTIGYYVDDGWFEPCPAVKNAVLKAVDCLKEKGHNVVEFQPPDISHAFGLINGAITVDAGRYLVDALSRDIFQKEYLPFVFPFILPYSIRMLLAYTVGFFIPRVRIVLSSLSGCIPDLRQIYAYIKIYRKKFAAEMQKKKIDLIVCPPNAGLAYRLGEPLKLFPTTSYTTLYNMLDFPAGVVPVCLSTKEDIENMKHYQAKDIWETLFKDSMSDPKLVNIPVDVQVAGPAHSEELICYAMKTIEEAVKKS